MDIKEIRVKNLNDQLKASGATRDEFANLLGYKDVNYLNQLLTGKGSFGNATSKKISKALGKDEGWLDRIHTSEHSINEKSSTCNTEPAQMLHDEVPIISWIQAGEWSEVMDLQHPVDIDYEKARKITKGSKVYALRIKGDSMTAPSGSLHSFPEGYLIEVDPMLSASEGDFVIAKVNGNNEATFKQLKSDGGRPYLRPLNPSHPPIFEEFRIIGKVVGVSLKL